MEEILASIRRIISEDDPAAQQEAAPAVAAAPAPAPPRPVAAPAPVVEDDEPLILEDEILELTDRIDDPPAHSVEDLEAFAPPPMAAAPAPPAPPPGPPPAGLARRDEPLVGAPAFGAAASAFDALERSVMMPAAGRSLEEVIREMLRPMLKAWLDENLPSIVEQQVAAEVERIARLRR